MLTVATIATSGLVLAACSSDPTPGPTESAQNHAPTPAATSEGTTTHYADPSVSPGLMTLTSSDFADGEALDDSATATAWGGQCTGANENPGLVWSGAPEGTKAYAITLVDTTQSFAHWVQANIPASVTSVARGGSAEMPGVVGSNAAGDYGYFGPCPPSGTHEYQFTVWALDDEVDAAPGISYDGLIAEIDGHVLATATLTGVRAAAEG